MKWFLTRRTNLEEAQRLFIDAVGSAKKAMELCKEAQAMYAKLQEDCSTTSKSEVSQLEKERDLANIRFNQLSKLYHQLQMRHQDWVN